MRRLKKANFRFVVVPLSEVPIHVLPLDLKKSPITDIAVYSGKPRSRSAIRLNKPAKRGIR